jgi:RimJ/RimL family protein N-acetyltransferase
MPNENAVIFLEPINSICYLVHVNFLKIARGKEAIQAGKDTLEYIFSETPCQKLIAWIAPMHDNVISFTIGMGFKLEGINKASFLKNGQLHDQHLYGLTKKEYESCQKQQ